MQGDARRIAKVVRAYESGELTRDRKAPPPLMDRNYARVMFRNDNAGTVPAHAVMRVTGMVQVDGAFYAFTTNKPDTTFYRLYLVNGSEDVPTGVYGWGTWLWHGGTVLYDTGNTPAIGEEWGPQNDEWSIKKYRYGFSIFGGNSGSGSTAKTYAVQTTVSVVYGQTQGAIDKGNTGTIEVYDGNDTILHASTTLTVKNKFGDLEDNAKVTAKWCGGSWYLDAGDCDP